jgi:hypothetical protein
MPAAPESARSSIILRLLYHAEHNWAQLAKVQARYHGSFACVTACCPAAGISRCSISATAAPDTPSASRFTHPPTTATKTPPCSPTAQEALYTARTVGLQRSDTNPISHPDELSHSADTSTRKLIKLRVLVWLLATR